ncbi:hypothetical protein DFH01_18965 [Falsiroseomonas bella]|uniref:AB hydrolase-1 domain-containing protein n=1 Tax=Falsiroseomonas bella TaxID=2184016 RepID=A0A317FB28_9PROT|nr:hypothetical protein [Falsiroseomonas bella]PWS35673.1 hypothetical protein DFH01_18965 [Falsiroseomonas bella]
MSPSTDPADVALAARLDGHRLLLCNGLLGEVIAGLHMDYMSTQLDWLRGLGLAVARAPTPTAAPIAENAARIATIVEGDDAPIILIGHSKGGLEALSALLMPGIAARCRGFLALQSPFRGSPVADAALGYGPLRDLADHALRLARLGDGQGLADLTCAVREPWMAAHEAGIAALTARLPVASLATALTDPCPWRDRAYLPLARWMEEKGAGPNDGLVPVSSTRLPGARHAVFPGGHRALVATGAGRDPVAFLRAELAALLGVAIPSPPPPEPVPHPPPR